MNTTEGKLLGSICAEEYSTFVKEFWHTVETEPLVWNWHMQVMCDVIQEACERVFRREEVKDHLIFNVPPSSSKSSIATVFLLPWCWTRCQWIRFFGGSYSHHLAVDLSQKSRDVVKSDLYRACYNQVWVREDKDAKYKFGNRRGGERYASGRTGAVTGKHFHIISIDDPINPNEALSEASLYNANHFCRQTVLSRKVDERTALVILTMQRLHQDDPTAQMASLPKTRQIIIPADIDYPIQPPELLKYYVDGLMDSVRKPRPVLEQKKVELGEYGYAGQYGQQPVPAGGGMFKVDRLRWGTPPTVWKRLVRFWDKAATAQHGGRDRRRSRGPAWTVGVKMGLDFEDRVWVVDVIRRRLDSHERERLIKRTALREPGVKVGQEQEAAGAGKESALGTHRRLIGIASVESLPARGPKEQRADEFSIAVNSGNVFLPAKMRDATGWVGWAKDYVEELKYWPYSIYLDQGDASAGGYSLIDVPEVRIGRLPSAAQMGRDRQQLHRYQTGGQAVRRQHGPRAADFDRLRAIVDRVNRRQG